MGTTEVKVINRLLEAAIELRHAAASLYRIEKRQDVIACMLPELCDEDITDLIFNDLTPSELMLMSHDELIEVINEKIETCGQVVDPDLEVLQEAQGS